MTMHSSGDSYIEGLKVINKKNGQTEWILTAKRADISDNGKTAHLADIEMIIEKKGIKIIARKGVYNLNNRDITITDTVTAQNDSFSIYTEDVDLDTSTGHLSTGSSVKIEGKKFELIGKGMEIDNPDEKIRILNDVKAVFHK